MLCEKALALNPAQAKEMVDLAREKGLFLMEAIWSRSFPSYKRIREIVHEEKAIGEVKKDYPTLPSWNNTFPL